MDDKDSLEVMATSAKLVDEESGGDVEEMVTTETC